MTIEVIAPGKMILVGEYAVLHGAPALVSAVNRVARVCLDTKPGRGVCVDAPEVQLNGFNCHLKDKILVSDSSEALPKSLKVVAAVLEHFADELEPQLEQTCLQITVDTSGFVQSENGYKLGLGSSAAVTVALMRAVMAYLGKEGSDVSEQSLFKRAHELHRKMQGGVGSGLDIAASVFGGLVAFGATESGTMVVPEKLEALSWPAMAPVFVGVSASTPDLVMKVNTWRDCEPQLFNKLMANMHTVAEKVIAASRSGDLGAIRKGCTEYCTLMQKLGEDSGADIISDAHSALRDASIRKGFDYKPSGAGGGDLGIVLAAETEELQGFRGSVEELGGSWTELGISSHGVQLVRK